MDSLKFCVDALERIKATSPGESSLAPHLLFCHTDPPIPVIGSALVLIYRELQVLDSNLIARNVDGSYHMSGLPNYAWQSKSDDEHMTGSHHAEQGWSSSGNQDPVAFAVPNFDALDIPPDFFNMLPELEPISANVNAGFDIDLDKPWY